MKKKMKWYLTELSNSDKSHLAIPDIQLELPDKILHCHHLYICAQIIYYMHTYAHTHTK